jgi:hypothetical protein
MTRSPSALGWTVSVIVALGVLGAMGPLALVASGAPAAHPNPAAIPAGPGSSRGDPAASPLAAGWGRPAVIEPATPSPSVDGTGYAACGSGGCPNGTWFSVGLTLTASSSLLVLVISSTGQEPSANLSLPDSLVTADLSDTAGTSWAEESVAPWCVSNGSGCVSPGSQYIFYGFDPASGTDTISVDTAGAGGSQLMALGATAVAVGLADVNPAQPFAASNGDGVSSGTNPNSTLTVETADFLLAIVSTNGTLTTSSPPPAPTYLAAVLEYGDLATSYPSATGVLGGVVTAGTPGIGVDVTLSSSSPYYFSVLDVEQLPPALTLAPASGPPGTVVTAAVSGFAASDTAIAVTDAHGLLCGISISGGTGSGDCEFDATPTNGFVMGPLAVVALGNPAADAASSSFTTTPAQATLVTPLGPTAAGAGPVGSLVNFSVIGLAPATAYAAEMDLSLPTVLDGPPAGPPAPAVDCAIGAATSGSPSYTTSGGGELACTMYLPVGAPGSFYLDLYQNPGAPAYVLTANGSAPGPFVVASASSGVSGTGPVEGPGGTEVDVVATALAATSVYQLDFSPSPTSGGPSAPPIALGCSAGSEANGFFETDSSGNLACSVEVPFGLAPGTSSFIVPWEVGSPIPTQISSGPSFLVTTPSLDLSPASGPVGTVLNLSGGGFAAGPSLPYDYYYCVTSSPTSTTCTGSLGAFGTGMVGGPYPGMIPGPPAPHATVASVLDPWVIVVDAQTGAIVAASEFAVSVPSLTLSVAQGPTGTNVTLSGSGFAAVAGGYVYDYCFATSRTASACASGHASSFLSTNGSVPPGANLTWTSADAAAGADALVVWDPATGTNVAGAGFLGTTPTIRLTPGYGVAGAAVTAIGTGFSVDGTVTLSIGAAGLVLDYASCSTGVANGPNLSANTSGGFECTLRLSSSVGPDPVSVTATDGTTGDTAATTFVALYGLDFVETGLSGVTWSVTVTGPSAGNFTGTQTVEGNGSSLEVLLPTGTYHYSVTSPSGWQVTSANGSAGNATLGVSGASVPVTFGPAPKASTFLGLPADEGYAVLAGVLAAAVAAGIGVSLYRRRAGGRPPTGEGTPSPSQPPESPPPGAAGPG